MKYVSMKKKHGIACWMQAMYGMNWLVVEILFITYSWSFLKSTDSVSK